MLKSYYSRNALATLHRLQASEMETEGDGGRCHNNVQGKL